MAYDTLFFVFALIDAALMLFLTVYFVITLSDLECDYLNATECCSRCNTWVIPELLLHASVTVVFLLSWHWILLLLNLPLCAWGFYRYNTIPRGNLGVFDPAEIHNRGQLKMHMKECMVKLAFHLIFFFVYLYCMILSLLAKTKQEEA